MSKTGASTPRGVIDAVLWTDGAARGNPGPSGIGAVLKTPHGEVIVAEGQYIGETTNNVAEYKALLLGLERALEHGVRHLEVRADSELLIKQLRGEYKVRSEGLKPLHQRALDLLKQFEAPKLVHVRRELNVEADRLANRGINEAKRAAKSGEPGPEGA
jgi:ribonuclease HI